MTAATVLAFAAMALLLIISPGPNGVLIAKTVPTSGRAAGFANIGGFVVAFFVHCTFAIFGLSILLLHSANLFFVVKLVGAAYLVWIGVKALYDAWQGLPTALVQFAPARRRRTLVEAFGEGFLTNALNPKVAMFYIAAFPQFVPPDAVSTLAAYLLVAVHACLNVAWFGPMVLLFDRLSKVARSGSVQRGQGGDRNGVHQLRHQTCDVAAMRGPSVAQAGRNRIDWEAGSLNAALRRAIMHAIADRRLSWVAQEN